MPGYSFFLIASLVAAGAVIAYLGDYIGRRLGRRRATVFGLRPRQTARLVSVLAGIVISGVTIGISVVVSRDVRVGFFQAERLRTENEDLQLTREALERQVRSTRGELAWVSGQRDSAAQQFERAVAQRDEVSGRLDRARQRLAKAEKRLGSVEKELRAANERRLAVDKQLASAREELRLAREALANASEDLDRYQEQLRKALEQEKELRGEQELLEGGIMRLQEERERLEREVETLTPYVQGNLAFLFGEQIAREVIPHQLSLEGAVARLEGLVAESERLARVKGSQPNGEGRVAVCVRERTGTSLAGIVREVADSIISSSEDMVVLVTSAANGVEGQPLVFELGLYPNYFLFSRGQPIRSMTVDSSLDQAEIFQQLNRLLDDAASTAFRHGVLRSERSPYTQELFNAVTEIKDVGGRPAALVVAAEDIWTAGPLSLALRVEAGQR